MAQPVVGLLVLPAVPQGLPEDAVFVAQPVAHGGQLERRHRIEEARREPPEPAVAQARVGLGLDQRRIGMAALHCLESRFGEPGVDDVVDERTAEQIFDRQVVRALGVFALVGLLGQQPALRDHVAHRARDRLELLARRRGRGIDHVIEQQVPFVQRGIGPRKLHRTAPVSREQRAPNVVHRSSSAPLTAHAASTTTERGWAT